MKEEWPGGQSMDRPIPEQASYIWLLDDIFGMAWVEDWSGGGFVAHRKGLLGHTLIGWYPTLEQVIEGTRPTISALAHRRKTT